MSLDDIARQVQPQADQGQAGARDTAACLVAYYRTLRAGGMNVESATYLTRDYQALILQAALGQHRGPA